MSQPAAKSQEPSMEEILASIRRIIADDDASKSAQAAADPPKAAEPPVEPAPPPPPPPPPPQAVAPKPRPVEPQPEPMPDMASMTPSRAIEEQSADILDLTEAMAASVPPPPSAPPPSAPPPVPPSPPAGMARPASGSVPQFRKISGDSDVGFDDPPDKAVPASDAAESQLLSRATTAAVDSAFNTLAQTVLVHNARTLEDLVREMLRPMLKSWLDENLPSMVERLVRAEIERVSRGR